MDNQHTLIKGYRDLSKDEIALINAVKEKEREILALIAQMQGAPTTIFSALEPPDPRWLAIGKTQIELGFMALIRSVAKPNT